MDSAPLRIAACATHPVQYDAPLWRCLAAAPGVAFQAVFGSDFSLRGYRDREFGVPVKWDVPLCAGYDHVFLSTSTDVDGTSFWKPSARGVTAALRAFRPDCVVLTSYGGAFHIGAFLAARRLGVGIVMRNEATDVAVARSPAKARVRDVIVKQVYGGCAAFACIGIEARRHFLRLGVEPERLFDSPYGVDTAFFAGEMGRWAPRREELRAELGAAPDDWVFVFSGKLIPKKDPLLIAEACARLSPGERRRVFVLFAGDGELREALRARVSEVLGARGRLLGFLNQGEIGRAYAAADALVLPSRRGAGETWGLVVNEGMQFGLLPLVSTGVGSGPDLVVEGAGAIFASGDIDALADALRTCLRLSPEERRTRAEFVKSHVHGFRTECAAAGLLEACRFAANPRR